MMTDYTQRITSEHRDKPNFVATVQTLAGTEGLIADSMASMLALFDVDVAEGQQLDMIGLWVGVKRQLQVPISGVYFGFDLVGLGWDQGVWQGPFDPSQGIISLDDGTYRILLKATIAANYWNGTVEDVQRIAGTALQGLGIFAAVLDRMDMSYDLLIIGSPSAAVLTLINRGVFPPKTAGVRLNSVIVSAHPLFGLDSQNAFIAGVDTGYFLG